MSALAGEMSEHTEHRGNAKVRSGKSQHANVP